MRIGIVGTGNMGRGLGLLWAEAGHEVCFGARRREVADAAVALGHGRCRAGSLEEAGGFGPVALWTVPDVPPADVIGDPGLLAGKTIVDLTNGPPAPGGVSRAVALAEGLPDALVVKAFNTLSIEALELCPDAAAAQGVQTYLAGDDAHALDVVAALADDIGLVPVRCGGLEQAADVEGAARVLIGRILEREAFLLRLALAPLQAVDRPARLGGRSPG